MKPRRRSSKMGQPWELSKVPSFFTLAAKLGEFVYQVDDSGNSRSSAEFDDRSEDLDRSSQDFEDRDEIQSEYSEDFDGSRSEIEANESYSVESGALDRKLDDDLSEKSSFTDSERACFHTGTGLTTFDLSQHDGAVSPNHNEESAFDEEAFHSESLDRSGRPASSIFDVEDCSSELPGHAHDEEASSPESSDESVDDKILEKPICMERSISAEEDHHNEMFNQGSGSADDINEVDIGNVEDVFDKERGGDGDLLDQSSRSESFATPMLPQNFSSRSSFRIEPTAASRSSFPERKFHHSNSDHSDGLGRDRYDLGFAQTQSTIRASNLERDPTIVSVISRNLSNRRRDRSALTKANSRELASQCNRVDEETIGQSAEGGQRTLGFNESADETAQGDTGDSDDEGIAIEMILPDLSDLAEVFTCSSVDSSVEETIADCIPEKAFVALPPSFERLSEERQCNKKLWYSTLGLLLCFLIVVVVFPVAAHRRNSIDPRSANAFIAEPPEPSGFPSLRPSQGPSPEPSASPSFSPSGKPSDEPSKRPSEVPSSVPSSTPSAAPSINPSRQPTIEPSFVPSHSPSHIPSQQPSKRPSEVPSSIPSSTPSAAPSINPSRQPTIEPSLVPSHSPSHIPSQQPSAPPSKAPSETPSFSSSITPSRVLSGRPSQIPIASPSSSPSHSPLSSPNQSPSANTSVQPSKEPSQMPSLSPSEVPTNMDSKNPSSRPSQERSAVPSTDYSASPTTFESSSPSKPSTSSPSHFPTKENSQKPSRQPTEEPSKAPSLYQSQSPTVFTVRPTQKPTISGSSFPSPPISSEEPTTDPTVYASPSPTQRPTIPTDSPTQFSTLLLKLAPVSLIAPSVDPSRSPTPWPTSIVSASPSQVEISLQNPVPTLSSPSSMPSNIFVNSPSSTSNLPSFGSFKVTQTPTTGPSSPSVSPTFSVVEIAESLSLTDVPTNPTHPLYRALYWATQQTTTATLQRVSLATFYFATEGEQWVDQLGFLSADDECAWSSMYDSTAKGVLCNADGSVAILALFENGLSGSIPKEIDMFSNLRMLWINDNAVAGSLPTELGNLNKLVHLDTISNQISGTIPSELASLPLLERLNIRNNLLTGSIPTLLSKIPSLGSLELARNSLTGDLTGVCDAHPDAVISADCEETTCPCCLICCNVAGVCDFTIGG